MVKTNTITVHAAEWDERAEEVAGALLAGGIVLFPTETVYGIGVSVTQEGLDKLLSLKNRPAGKPFQILISDPKIFERWGAAIDPPAEKLMNAFWPGPMTLVLEVDPEKAPITVAASGTIGFRIPGHYLCLDLVRRCGGTIIATSANPGGDPEARSCAEAKQHFFGKLAAAVDAGRLPENLPSTVVSVKNGVVTVLRKGAISEEKIMDTALS